MSSAVEVGSTCTTAEAGRLYEVHREHILGYCLRRLRCRSEAEDAVQTTFLHALRALRRGVVPECESAWLHTIARNVCNSQQRTATRRGPVSDGVEPDSLAAAEPEVDAELLTGLRDALESLPVRQRQALVLREWHGVPPREIAAALGLTAPQTHALLTRARQALAHALTAPLRGVLVLASLSVGLRAHVKALLGGASVKAAAITVVAVTGAGITGSVADTGAAKQRVDPVPAGVRGVALVPRDEVGSTPATAVQTRGGGAAPGERGARTPSNPPPVAATAPEATPSGAAAATDSGAPAGAARETAESPPPATRQELLPGARVDLPTELLPPLELPAVEVPVELPPLEVPGVELPPVELPPVQLPPVQVPSLDEDDPPLLEVPSTTLPLSELPLQPAP